MAPNSTPASLPTPDAAGSPAQCHGRPLKFAYFVKPHIGGTFTVFEHLRNGLREHGTEVLWLGTEQDGEACAPIPEPHRGTGSILDRPRGADERALAGALMRKLEVEGFDGVFINVLADRLQMNIARYLPPDLLRIMIVHNITPGTYAAARALRDSVHGTVGVSERCRRDLVARFGFDMDRTVAIPNAIDAKQFGHVRMPPEDGAVRVLFLGRVEDASKGVFWLPRILSRLPPSVTLTVAGDGPDLPALRQRFDGDGRVRFVGPIASPDVPGLFARHDIFLMPSRFEGLPMALLEAMAGGCVPVASQIADVTDRVVHHGREGLLFPMGDWHAAGELLRRLQDRPDEMAAMSKAARAWVAQEFNTRRMGAAYAGLIARLRTKVPRIDPPRALDNWNHPAGLRPGLRTYLPAPVKNWLRIMRERL